MNCELCVHTSDKHYTTHDIERSSQISEKTKYNANALNKTIWDLDTIYWKRESNYEWIDNKIMDKMITASFLESSMVTPLKIQKRNRKMSDAQITINWLGKKDDKYFTSESTLAYAWGPGMGLGGNVVMNSDNLWLLRKTPLTTLEAKELGYIDNYSDPKNIKKFYDPLHTLKHEAGGHALGMNHITDIEQRTKSIMFPYYNGLRRFGEADLNYIQSLYGKSGVWKETQDMIRMRINNF